MSDKRRKIIENLMMNSIAFEALLKTFKTSLYNEWIHQCKSEIDRIKSIPSIKYTIKGESKGNELQKLKLKIKYYKTVIARTEKYNSEVTKMLTSRNEKSSIESFIENSIDHYGDFTELLQDVFDGITETSPTKYVLPALLVKDPKGTLFHEGEQYTIKTK